MFLARFDDPEEFFDWLGTKTEAIERYHTQYAVDDPPTSYMIYPLARSADGTWVAQLTLSIPSDDVRWEGSTRLSDWGW